MEEALKTRQSALEQDVIACLNEIKVLKPLSAKESHALTNHIF